MPQVVPRWKCSSSSVTGMTQSVAVQDASDTYFERQSTSPKTDIRMTKVSGLITRNTLTPTSTPFPPRKPCQSGNTCPSTTKIAAT